MSSFCSLCSDLHSIIFDYFVLENISCLWSTSGQMSNAVDKYILKYNSSYYSFAKFASCAACGKYKNIYLLQWQIDEEIEHENSLEYDNCSELNASRMCFECIINSLWDWFQDNSISIYNSEDPDPERGYHAYKLCQFTKYESSYVCQGCLNKVNPSEKLIGVLLNEDHHKYQDTYHVNCFIEAFADVIDIYSMSVPEIVNVSALE